MAACSLSVC
uniref:Uncharacterized protein n=1 Tax=Arundo donax TaxID=35708 RepID=A0A0A9FL00_ARUDO